MRFDPQMRCLSRRAPQISAICTRHGRSPSRYLLHLCERGLGWNLPASVGVALAERDSGRNRPVITVIGDGSFQYSVQSIWSAAQLHLPMLILVLRNEEYCILKSFAVHEEALVFPASIFLGSTSSRWPEAMGAMRRASTILARSRKPPPKPG